MDIEKLFNNIDEETFWEILNNEDKKLRLYNKEWQKYNSICSKVMRNKRIQNVIEEGNPLELSKKDSEELIQYHLADVERQIIENREMFNAGFRYAYHLFRKTHLIVEDENDLSA